MPKFGQKGLSRWIVDGKLYWLLNHLGMVIGWDYATANIHDTYFQPMLDHDAEQTVIYSDVGFHAKEGDHPNLKVCKPHTHNERMIIETSLSILTTISHFKKVFHRTWDHFKLGWLSQWQC